jgi:hypothetical protein
MKDNFADAVTRGRWKRPQKLSDEQVIEIRASLLPIQRLAEQFEVSAGLISLIRSKEGHRVVAASKFSRRKELVLQGVRRQRSW